MAWRIATCLLAGLFGLAAPAAAQTTLEQQVLVELNRARANPAGYADGLRAYRRFYQGKIVSAPSMKVRYVTQEGVAPLDEAVLYLQAQQRRRPLSPAAILRDAASDHCADQAGDGAVGHGGSDGTGPGDRVARRGGGNYVGEVITYGSDTAEDVVRQLIVDDGVDDRGHRKLVFADDIDFAGVSCGPHPAFGTMCVIDVARTRDGRARLQFAAR
jgi:uncharacterized protein YkwD